MIENAKKVLLLFNKGEKKKLLLIFFMMIVSALFETFGIGVIVPFVGIVTNPSMITEQASINYLYKFFNFQSTTTFMIFAVIALLFIFIVKKISNNNG